MADTLPPATVTVDFTSLSPEKAQEMVDKLLVDRNHSLEVIQGITIGVYTAFAEIQRVGRLG